MATIEDSIAALTTATTALSSAVAVQQNSVNNAIAQFNAAFSRIAQLNLVNNTADIDKVISTAVTASLALKQPNLVSGVNISTVNGVSLMGGQPLVIARSATSLNRVLYDDRNNLRLTISQVDDSTVVDSLGLFMWTNTQLEPDDDETCFTTSTGQWLLKTPANDLLEAWSIYETSINDDWKEDESIRFAAFQLTK